MNDLVFIKYNICDFYPSMIEKGLTESLNYAKQFESIQPEHMELFSTLEICAEKHW